MKKNILSLIFLLKITAVVFGQAEIKINSGRTILAENLSKIELPKTNNSDEIIHMLDFHFYTTKSMSKRVGLLMSLPKQKQLNFLIEPINS